MVHRSNSASCLRRPPSADRSTRRSQKLWRIVFGTCAASALAAAGCGGDDSPADTTGGTNTTGGSSSTGGASGSCVPPTNPLTCEASAAPEATLVDFTNYQSNGNWGVMDTNDLTGGTSLYDGDGDDSVNVLSASATGGMLNVTGTVPIGSYAGFVLWFGPCVDASQVSGGTGTSGVSVPIGGDLGGSSLKFQVQTHTNYPVDGENMKGGCVFADCDTRWDECVGPTLEVGTIAAEPEAMEFAWADFAGGLPSATATTDGNGVVGVQFQFECGVDPSCPIDVTFGSMTLTPAE